MPASPAPTPASFMMTPRMPHLAALNALYLPPYEPETITPPECAAVTFEQLGTVTMTGGPGMRSPSRRCVCRGAIHHGQATDATRPRRRIAARTQTLGSGR